MSGGTFCVYSALQEEDFTNVIGKEKYIDLKIDDYSLKGNVSLLAFVKKIEERLALTKQRKIS